MLALQVVVALPESHEKPKPGEKPGSIPIACLVLPEGVDLTDELTKCACMHARALLARAHARTANACMHARTLNSYACELLVDRKVPTLPCSSHHLRICIRHSIGSAPLCLYHA